MNQTKKISRSSDIQVRCRQCHRLLCKRIVMHRDKDEIWGLEIKHRKMEIITPEITLIITCPACGSKSRINSNHGVERCLKI